MTRRANDAELLVGRLLIESGYRVMRSGFAGLNFESTPDLIAWRPPDGLLYAIEVKSRMKYMKGWAKLMGKEHNQRARLIEWECVAVPRYAVLYRDTGPDPGTILWLNPRYLESSEKGKPVYFSDAWPLPHLHDSATAWTPEGVKNEWKRPPLMGVKP